MAVRAERYGTYNQTVGVKIDMDDAIQILSPHDVPLQGWVGMGEPCQNIKVEWLEEDLTPQSDTIATSGVSGTDTPWTVTVTDTGIFRPGDVLWVQGAASAVQFVVTSITNGTVMVIDGFAGNAVDPVDGNVLVIIGQWNKEGNDPQDPRSTERTAKYNYTQIGQEAVQATRTSRTVGRNGGIYGQGDPYDHELGKKFKELAIRFERSMIHGQRSAPSGGKRFMGGLLYYITTNAQSGVKANALALVTALLKSSYEAGGTPRTLMVSPAVKIAIDLNVDQSIRRTERTEKTGGSVIDHIDTSLGKVDLVVNRFFPATKGILLQGEFIKRRVLAGYFHELLAKTGDSDKGEIVGEQSLEVKNEKAHGLLTLTDA